MVVVSVYQNVKQNQEMFWFGDFRSRVGGGRLGQDPSLTGVPEGVAGSLWIGTGW